MIPLAPFRIPRAGEHVNPSDWKSCLEAWRLVLRLYLALPSDKFKAELHTSQALPDFLVTYFHELAIHDRNNPAYPLDSRLHHDCFALIHRAWFSNETPPTLLLPSFLKQFCLIYGDIPGSAAIMDRLWAEKLLHESHPVLEDKASLQHLLETRSPKSTEHLQHALLETRVLAKVCHRYGKFLMVGSDFLDALVSGWNGSSVETKQKITFLTYTALLSLMLAKEASFSTLVDHLYTLRMDYEKVKSGPSILADLVTKTPFVYKYRRITHATTSGRVADMLTFIEKVGKPPRAKGSTSKGKRPFMPVTHDVDLSQSAQISQVHELFPELGLGYIARLLSEYDYNSEAVTAHLLDNSLPPHLQDANREETLDSYQSHNELQPRREILANVERRNAFDNDEFDQLKVSLGRLHIGKKSDEDVLSQPIDKRATLAALAALDSDEDERDDTYDVEDVGGTVDIESPEHDRGSSIQVASGAELSEEAEAAMFHVWNREPEVFSRKPTARTSGVRVGLREKTGWTDEQIEGWAIMLRREPKRAKRLREKFSDDYYLRQAKESAVYENDGSSTDFDSDRAAATNAGRGRGRPPRGNRGRDGRGGGNAAGPANERSTQIARQRKDANKAARGNHNRREQRAKKMARGM